MLGACLEMDVGPSECQTQAMKKLFPGKTLAEIFKVAFADQLRLGSRNLLPSPRLAQPFAVEVEIETERERERAREPKCKK